MSIEKLIKIILENELIELNEDEITIFFDMDGVLAAFDKSISKNEKANELKLHLDKMIKERKPELFGLNNDELRAVFKGKQEDPDMAAIKKLWNKHRNLTYSVANKPGFFENLEMLPGAVEMLLSAKKFSGKMPNILTAPMESNPRCKEEKYNWVKTNIAGLYKNFYCTQEKQKYANSKYDILIDDRPKYIDRFLDAGGSAILHVDPATTIKELEETVENLRKINEFSAIGGGAASMQSTGQIVGTGGNPLGGDMSKQHEIMWSGDKTEKKNKRKTKK